MDIQPIELRDLHYLHTSATQGLVDALRVHGFAIVRTRGFSETDAIVRALQKAQTMTTFRFPSHSEESTYSDDQREAFRGLFHWTRICLRALLYGLDPSGAGCADILHSLKRTEEQIDLFPPNGQGNSPFSEGVEFSGSFFNIFHYDYGLLNHHKDRYLVTAVAVQQQSPHLNKTALWAHSPTAGWVNVDEHLHAGEIAIFTGEDFEEISAKIGTLIPAVQHCTRVDPTTERLVCIHNQPDPSTPTTGNRVSVAFVLSEGNA